MTENNELVRPIGVLGATQVLQFVGWVTAILGPIGGIKAKRAWWRRSKSLFTYRDCTVVSFLLRTDLRKLPDPQAGSRKRESIRSDSVLTKFSMSSTIQLGVKTSPWSATRCLDFTKLSGDIGSPMTGFKSLFPVTSLSCHGNPHPH